MLHKPRKRRSAFFSGPDPATPPSTGPSEVFGSATTPEPEPDDSVSAAAPRMAVGPSGDLGVIYERWMNKGQSRSYELRYASKLGTAAWTTTTLVAYPYTSASLHQAFDVAIDAAGDALALIDARQSGTASFQLWRCRAVPRHGHKKRLMAPASARVRTFRLSCSHLASILPSPLSPESLTA